MIFASPPRLFTFRGLQKITFTIKQKKFGRKGKPSYRIVATDSRVKRDGKAIEELGYYNPFTKETYLKVNEIKSRLQTGAQPTETVRNIFKKAKILDSV